MSASVDCVDSRNGTGGGANAGKPLPRSAKDALKAAVDTVATS